MEQVYDGKENCTGCEACKDGCPTGAIQMAPDEEGFLYPVIEESLCIDCNDCVQLCPVLRENHYKNREPAVFYVGKHRSEEVLRRSTSGGAFTALSDAILEQGGTVYGADFTEDFQVIHRRGATQEERNNMRISKYSQSQMGECYSQMQNDLAEGKEVLFAGTPCQTAGMRARFEGGKHTEHLYLCDLICHSIPSPMIWREYLKLLEQEAGGKIEHVQFRSKLYDWSRANSNKGFLYQIEGEESFREDDRFYVLFTGKNQIVRPSCYACPFTDVQRTSDLTIADYWGIETFAPEWYDPLGVSVILENTPKGAALLQRAAVSLQIEERPSEESTSQQNRLSRPGDPPANREEFWTKVREEGFPSAVEFALKE